MKADDLAHLMTPGRAADLNLHIGRITLWNATTGQNRVEVAGGPMVDLPMLNIGDTTNLAVGNTVAILKFKNTYFIIGRVVAPNSTVFASASVDFEARNVNTDNYAITTTEAIVATATMNVPSWANRALVHATCHFNGRNDRAVDDFFFGAVWVSSNNGGQLVNEVDAGATGMVSASYSINLTVTGGTTFDVTGRCRTNGGTWSTSGLNGARLSVSCVYRKA